MSSSRSSTATSQETNDNRVAVESNGFGVSGGGDVTVHMVADEAFELGYAALEEMRDLATSSIASSDNAAELVGNSLTDAMAKQLEALRTEESQLSSQMLKIGVPAAALAYIAAQIWGK